MIFAFVSTIELITIRILTSNFVLVFSVRAQSKSTITSEAKAFDGAAIFSTLAAPGHERR